MGRLVVPIFYYIEPSAVHHQTGSFGKAFHKYQTYVDVNRLAKWRVSLANVAKLRGHKIGKHVNEADIISEVVNKVLLEINPIPLDVAKYPVGLDSRVEDIAKLMSSKTKGINRIGIHGMGGVGKTTLAKAVYNQNYQRFQGSCFLANVREVSKTEKGLVCLQQQLVNDILKCKNIIIDNIDQGIEVLRARIGYLRVLIVIDDLDNPMPLEFLEGPFVMGSIIIITTRNEDLLDSIKVDARYKVDELGDAESRQLFTLHAFGNDNIPDAFRELSQEILERAGGLPLALEVFGSNLREERMICIDKLKQLSIADVEQKLLISFDGLRRIDPMLQDIFLDIACFFIGQKKEEVLNIMKTCYTFVNRSIDILEKRCLITINNREELEMHDLLRDMGREIARNNSPDEPEKHSRLWELKDIYHVLKNHKGTEAIECIVPYKVDYKAAFEEVSFAAETFRGMSNLRFLHLYGDITGSFEEMFEDLRWLRWDWCPLTCLPSEFDPPNLVILELPHSKITRMFELNMVSRVFVKLQTLNMPNAVDLTATPDFTKLPYLKTLNLEGCKSLKQVDISIGSLARLVSLNLNSCRNLKSLPNSICNLRALEVLNINKCSCLEALPTELGNIGPLKMLNAKGLAVSELPDSIGRLSKLVVLNLSYNYKLRTLPNTICHLKALEVLRIGGCNSLVALPKELGNIESLKELKAWRLRVVELPDSIGCLSNLVHLDLQVNKNLETLPKTICNLRSLEFFNISGCEKLAMLPDKFWKLTRIRKLDASGATLLKELPHIKKDQIELPLEYLALSRSAVTALPFRVSQLSNLKYIFLVSCIYLLSIAELPPNLKLICAYGCLSLEKLPNLSHLKLLEELDLTNCNELKEIEGLEELTSIKVLRLGGCNPSLLENTLTQSFFQIYCGFEHQITVYIGLAGFPNWVSESSNTRGSTVSTNLLPIVSPSFLGMILCFEAAANYYFTYSVRSTASDFIWSSGCDNYYGESVMVILPRSIFWVRNGDQRIEVQTNAVKIHGIHPLFTRAITTIETSNNRMRPFKRFKQFFRRFF
ncbi:hypothetical protein ACET3Z_006535 [Daucus carota]